MHLLQGLDIVCFASLKHNWALEIKMFESENFHGIGKNDFAKAFGSAYQRTFTPNLIQKVWEATSVRPLKPN
ncbi:hypothetical protein BDM02DRAFT_3241088, partial [Thelephora ganbajun]